MATTKKTAANPPVKRAPRKRVKRSVWQRLLLWYRKSKVWLFVVVALIAVILYFIFKNPSLDSINKKADKAEQTYQKGMILIDSQQVQNRIEKAVADALQQQAEKEAADATVDRVNYEKQSYKKKEQTKLKYDATNKEVKAADTNIDKLDAIFREQQRARKKVLNGG